MSLPQNQLGEHVSLRCPAKVNLRLKVTGRRDDGYHYLSMINAQLELSDILEVAITRSTEISVSVDWQGEGKSPDLQGLSDVHQNLATRAVREFRERFGLNFGARIHIKKHIPLGGGLGGGSSNAAAVLAFLFGRFRSELPERSDQIQKIIAATLGADVPYLLRGGLAWVGGIGEEIVQLSSEELERVPVALIFPPFGVSTAAVFAKVDPAIFKDDSRCDAFRNGRRDSPSLALKEVWSLVDNDLIEPARLLKAELQVMLDALSKDSELCVSMSGSGSTLFAVSRTQDESSMVNERVRAALKGHQATIVMSSFATSSSDSASSLAP